MSINSKRFVELVVPTIILIISFQNCGQSFFSAPQDPVLETPLAVPAPVAANKTTQYLLFQDFSGSARSSDGTYLIDPDQTNLKTHLVTYVERINAKIKAPIAIASDRKYGFAIGPLGIELSDQAILDTIKIAFDVAIEKKVAVSIHFDITHFWKYAKNADGTLLSEGTGANDVHEWKDFNGTIADKDPWDGEPLLAPMCFECAKVKAIVARLTKNAIIPGVQDGMKRLKDAGEADLFAGVILGWESNNGAILYHSLKVKSGFSASTTVADLVQASQQINHDYVVQWTKPLFDAGIPRDKIFTHMAFSASADDNAAGRDGTDYWIAFNDYSNAGFSIYPASTQYQNDLLSGIWAEAAKHSGSWGETEGTNTNGLNAGSVINWETYLGKIFNHGGTMANVFGGFMDQHFGYYTTATESDEAVATYQKFLRGETLVEANAAASPTSAATACPKPLPSGAPASLATDCQTLADLEKAGTIIYPIGPIMSLDMLNSAVSDQIASGNYTNADAIIQMVLNAAK